MFRDDETPAPTRPRRTRCLRTAAAALVVGLVGWAAPAGAHVTITASTTAAGAYAVLEVSVGHGCDGSPTTKITIQMPPEINSVTPTRNALWEVDKQMERLDPPVADAHGNEIVERVASVSYTADTPLPDGYRDTFELSVQLPDDEGGTLVFPTIQTCEQGESAWIEVPQDGQDVEALELPAPSLVISEAAEGGHHDVAGTAGPATVASDGEGDGHGHGDGDDGPVAAADSDGADALTVTALAAGLLGAALGGAALVRQRRRA